MEKLALCCGNLLSCRGGVRVGGKTTMWKSSRIARQLNPNCSFQRLKVNNPKYKQCKLI
jgi:hypothetical protein